MRAVLLSLVLCLAGACAGAAVGAAAGPDEPPFAVVGDTSISQQAYEQAFAQAARSRFYHGKPPDGAVATLQREVGQQLIDAVLLDREIQRRGLRPDAAAIQRELDGYDQRYAGSAIWQRNRAEQLPRLRAKLESDQLLEQLRAQVRQVAPPTEPQLQQYWAAHPDKFTAPEQVKIGMILLKVEPSAPQAQWDGARDEGAAIVRRLREGADFAQLAALHSADASSSQGGDMGYLHRGMLPEPAQKAVDALQPGQISDAVFLLEGVAVFRLDARQPARLNPLDKVRERAQDLWLRDQAEAAWSTFLQGLRAATPVQRDESRFLPLANSAAAPPAAVPAPAR